MDTALDRAHGAMAGGDEAAARAFWQVFADAPLFLLLEGEAAEGVLRPRLFPLSEGPVVLVFDSEERLAGFADGPQDYAELPGRVIAAELAGQGIGLGLNLGSGAVAEALFGPDSLSWLVEMLGAEAEPVLARLAALAAPLPDSALEAALRGAVQGAAGLAASARLLAARHADGREGHLLWVIGAAEAAQAPLARAFAEALAFAGLEDAGLDVVFDMPGGVLRAQALALGLVLDFPALPVAPRPPAPRAPGSDPDRPPRLR